MTNATLHSQPPTSRAESPRTLRHGAIALRSPQEVECIARAGRVVAQALRVAEQLAAPGVTTSQIDAAVAQVIAQAGASAAFLHHPSPMGGHPYPASCCTSVNSQVVHGIPGPRVLVDGDVLSIDVGVELDDWYADAATTVQVGSQVRAPAGAEASQLETSGAEHRALITAAWSVLHSAIGMMEPGRRWSSVAQAMQRRAVDAGCGMVDGWMGHGIGRQLHEPPQVPCMVSPGLRERRDFTLQPGMVLAVEPILVAGGGSIDADGCCVSVPVSIGTDGWTVSVDDGRPAAHVEHTVAVLNDGARILTTECLARGHAHRPDSRTPVHGGGCRSRGSC